MTDTNAPLESFIDTDQDVVVMVGGVLPSEVWEDPATMEVLVAPGTVRLFPLDFVPLFEFFQEPRSVARASEWLAGEGLPPNALADLVGAKHLVQVRAGSPTDAIKDFAGIRVIPQCVPLVDEVGACGQVLVAQAEDQPAMYGIPEIFAEAMWGRRRERALPISAAKLSRRFGVSADLGARLLLTPIPSMLRWRLARLEWIKPPDAARRRRGGRSESSRH